MNYLPPCCTPLVLIWQNCSKAEVTLTACLLRSRWMWIVWLQNSSRLAMASSQEQQNLHDVHPACCGLCALHAQPPCNVTYRKDACAGVLLNPITDSDVNSATGISASIALTVSAVADSQSVHLEGGTTTRLRRSSPGRWNRPMIGWPSALMVSIENDTTISPVARSVQRSQIAATVNGSPSWRWMLHGTALPVSQHGSKNRSTGTRQNCRWRHAVR